MNLENIIKENKKIKQDIKKLDFKREIYSDLKSTIERGKSVLLSGLRQIGKTTIMKQLLSELDDSFYITLPTHSIKENIENIVEQLYFDYNAKFIFIDEIQNIENWGSWVIDLYNKFSTTTFIISGSSSISVSDTTGSIRFKEINMEPLNIQEYKEFLNSPLNGTALLNDYIGKNAVIGMAKDDKLSWTEAKEQYFSTFIFKDILKYETNVKFEELYKFIQVLKLTRDGEINKKNACEYIWGTANSTTYYKLEQLILILVKYNVLFILKRKNIEGSESKKAKYYMNPHLFVLLQCSAYNNIPKEYHGYIIESLIIFYVFKKEQIFYIKQTTNSKYNNHEVDFVIDNKWYEVKATNNIKNIIKNTNKLFIEFNKKGLNKQFITFSHEKSIKGIKNIYLFDLLKFLDNN